MDTKFAGFSKLNWLGLATAVAPFVSDTVQQVITAHPSAAAGGLGIAIMILRTFFTSTAVTLKPAGLP